MNYNASIKAYRFLFSILLFLTPLLVVLNTNELYEFPKMFFVYFLGSTVMFVFLLNFLLQDDRADFKRVPPVILVFVIVNIFSTAFSSHIYTSIWGYYTRFNGGIISLFIFFGLYFVLINIKKHLDREQLLLIPVITLIPISLYAFQQHYMNGLTRAYSTFGNPNWLALYIIMLLPMVLHFILNTESFKAKYLLTGIFAISYGALWFTYSLSGLLGLAISIFFYVILNRELVTEKRKFLLGLFAFAAIFSLLQPGIYANRIRDVLLDLNKVYAQENAGEEVATGQVSDPGFIRLNVWKGTWELTRSSPKNLIIGSGPETFPYAFQQYRPAELNYSSEWDFILNKPHNYYLEILSETGLLGLGSYVGVIIYTLRKKHKFIAPGLAGYYSALFFGFPVVPVALLFWVYVGFLYEN